MYRSGWLSVNIWQCKAFTTCLLTSHLRSQEVIVCMQFCVGASVGIECNMHQLKLLDILTLILTFGLFDLWANELSCVRFIWYFISRTKLLSFGARPLLQSLATVQFIYVNFTKRNFCGLWFNSQSMNAAQLVCCYLIHQLQGEARHSRCASAYQIWN